MLPRSRQSCCVSSCKVKPSITPCAGSIFRLQTLPNSNTHLTHLKALAKILGLSTAVYSSFVPLPAVPAL